MLPGWGQLATGHRLGGWALITTSLVLLAAVCGLVGTVGAVEIMATLANPQVITALLGVNLVLAASRLAVSLHAWLSAGGRAVGGLLLLAVLTLAPHAVVARAGVETRQTLVTVFSDYQDRPATGASAATTTLPFAPATSVPRPLSQLPLVPDLDPPQNRHVSTLPARLNLLLLGGDAGPRRSGIRTDTMIVASVDTATGATALFGIPRNYGGIVFSDGTPFPGDILNEVYQWGWQHPDRFGSDDPGAAALIDVIENMTGLAIDHYLLVDLTGFGAVVDALGGVTVNVPRPVTGPLYDPATGAHQMVTIPRGSQHLDGNHALAYVRSRLGTTDYDRMRRQRCLLWAVADQVEPARLLARFRDLLEVAQSHVRTDLPVQWVGDLIRLAPRVGDGGVHMVGFGPGWSRGVTAKGYRIPDVDKIRATVAETLAAATRGDDAVEFAQACS